MRYLCIKATKSLELGLVYEIVSAPKEYSDHITYPFKRKGKSHYFSKDWLKEHFRVLS